MVKLQSLVEYLMAGIELSGDVSIYVVGGCKYYTNFANIMKETLGDKAIICNPTKEVDHSSHGCWKVVNDMMEGKVKIEGSDCVWGLEEVNEESKQQCEEDKKKMDKQGEGDESEDVNEQGTSGSDRNPEENSEMKERMRDPKGDKNESDWNAGQKRDLYKEHKDSNIEKSSSKSGSDRSEKSKSTSHSSPIGEGEIFKYGNPQTKKQRHSEPRNNNSHTSEESSENSSGQVLSHPVTIKVCEYQRLPIPHKLKSVDYTTSIRDFMKKMLIQEKEILKMNSISTLWNDISKRIYEKIDKLRDQDKADEMLLELHALDKKKYAVLMDSVDEMNKEWKELAGKLKVEIENEMAQISVIQNEWNEEKASIENEVDNKAKLIDCSKKRSHEEITNEGKDNESKKIQIDVHGQYVQKLLQLQKELIELQDQLLKQEERQQQLQQRLQQQQLLQQQQQQSNENYTQLVGNLQLLMQEHLSFFQSELNKRLQLYYYDKNSICYQIRVQVSQLKDYCDRNQRYSHRLIGDLSGNLEKQLRELQNYDIGNNSLDIQEQLLPMLQQLELQYKKKSTIPYTEILDEIQQLKLNRISIYSRIKELRDTIISNYSTCYIDDYLNELKTIQKLLSFRFYEMNETSHYLTLVFELQQCIPLKLEKDQDQDQDHDQYHTQDQSENQNQKQNQSENNSSFHMSKLQQIASIQKGLSMFFSEVLPLGIDGSSSYPQLDYFIELLLKYVNGFYSYYNEIQEQLEKLPKLLEELKQKSIEQKELSIMPISDNKLQSDNLTNDVTDNTKDVTPSDEKSDESSSATTQSSTVDESSKGTCMNKTEEASAENHEEPNVSGDQGMYCG